MTVNYDANIKVDEEVDCLEVNIRIRRPQLISLRISHTRARVYNSAPL